MHASLVVEFLILLGADDATIREDKKMVQSSCPLARWLHRPAGTTTQSLLVRMYESQQEPRFHCSVCGARGSLTDLLHELQTLSTELYPEATSLLAQWEAEDPWKKGHGPRRVRVDLPPPEVLCHPFQAYDPIDMEALDQFPLLIRLDQRDSELVIKWLRTHWRITPGVIRRAQLRLYYDQITKEPGVAIPVFTPGGNRPTELWGWPMDSNSGRQVFPSSYGSQPSNQPHPLFGLERLEPDASVILVQHPLAALRLETLGFKNVVGTTTSGNLELAVLEAFPCVYLAFDDSEQGSALTRRAFRLLKRPQIILLRWYVARNSAGQHLHGPLDLENLAQFRLIFDERIALMKS
jgi:hypothetical protein